MTTQFIVQEQYQNSKHPKCWYDEPAQPEESKRSLASAREWLEKDYKENHCHFMAFLHRIIERVEHQAYPMTEYANNWPNSVINKPGSD